MNQKTILITTCPACRSEAVKPIFEQNDFPAILFPIEKQKVDSVDRAQLAVSVCSECAHMFINKIDTDFNKKIYSDYYYLYPYSDLESMNDKYRKPFHRTFDYLFDGQKDKTLLEIGCSDENQFSVFLEKNITCTGVSPEAMASDTVTMIDGFYEDQNFDDKFDYIISRFNLEHIIDPDDFLEKVKSDIANDGTLIIQVPNEETLLESGVLNIFAHEHTQYFNHNSLRILLERHGFSITIMTGRGEPSLIACARLQSVDFSPSQRYEKNVNVVKQIDQLFSQNNDKKFVIYGAGLSLTALLYNSHLSLDKVDQLSFVDDNTILQGRFMPHSNACIQSPQDIVYDDDTIILLFLNPIYHDKVLSKLSSVQSHAIYKLTDGGLSIASS